MSLKKARAEAHKTAMAAMRLVEEKGAKVTDEELAAMDEAVAAVKRLDASLEKARSARQALEGLAAEEEGEAPRTAPDGTGMKAEGYGERFTASETYQAFMKRHPGGPSDGADVKIDPTKVATLGEYVAGRKSSPIISTEHARLAKERRPMIDLVTPPDLTLLDLIGSGRMRGAFEYLQLTAVQNNAKVVQESTSDDVELKPISGITTALADCKSSTFADGMDITTQLLADDLALASALSNIMDINLQARICEQVLKGNGSNGAPRGILNTTGVQEVTYTAGTDATTAMVESVLKGKTKLRKVRGTASAIIVNPEDDEAINLLKDKDGRYLGGGPWSLAPSTLWGIRRVVSEDVEKGTAIMGDFSQVQLLDHQGLAVEMFKQHKDYAQRNRVYVRAELRAGLCIWRPAHLVVLKKG